MTKQKIIIGLCTANRPKMLAECVASLKIQEIPENIELYLLVVENTEQSNFPYELAYIHEPKRDIPIAGNRFVDEALEKNADWIAFNKMYEKNNSRDNIPFRYSVLNIFRHKTQMYNCYTKTGN